MDFELEKKQKLEYNIGLTFITLAFIYLLYSKLYSKKLIYIPKMFLILYSLGGIFLVIKNIYEKNLYIAICEFIGVFISMILFFM